MAYINIPAKKFQLLVRYLKLIGLEATAITATVGMNLRKVMSLPPEQMLPAIHYSCIYKAAMGQLEEMGEPIIWGAGVGSESFEMMCHSMIGARTLEEALWLAARFDKLLYRQNHYRVTIDSEATRSMVTLGFSIEVPEVGSTLVPGKWDRADYALTVAKASGLRTWHSLCGWMIGQSLSVRHLYINAPPVNREYQNSLARVFRCPVTFDAGENAFTFERSFLERRIVQTHDSLLEFLNNSVYHLIGLDLEPAQSTSRAIRSLILIELQHGMPLIGDVASMLYTSESSLRRRLQEEGTCYQAIKDEIRCEIAIDKLLNDNLNIAEVAGLLGFTESSTFVRVFKKWTGYTPRSYRQQFRTSKTAPEGKPKKLKTV